jgi:hypothetical protein
MKILLKTRCGCTREMDTHYTEYSTPAPMWVVPLEPNWDSYTVAPPVDYIPINDKENRVFRYTGEYTSDQFGRCIHIYKEE